MDEVREVWNLSEREQEKYNLSIIIEWTKNSWRLARRRRSQLPEHNGIKVFWVLIFEFQAIFELLITVFHEMENSEFTWLFQQIRLSLWINEC